MLRLLLWRLCLEMKKTWTVEVELDEHGEPALTLPEDMIKQIGWKIGDIIRWSRQDDGSWILERVL
jgi:hypothetical protein